MCLPQRLALVRALLLALYLAPYIGWVLRYLLTFLAGSRAVSRALYRHTRLVVCRSRIHARYVGPVVTTHSAFNARSGGQLCQRMRTTFTTFALIRFNAFNAFSLTLHITFALRLVTRAASAVDSPFALATCRGSARAGAGAPVLVDLRGPYVFPWTHFYTQQPAFPSFVTLAFPANASPAAPFAASSLRRLRHTLAVDSEHSTIGC